MRALGTVTWSLTKCSWTDQDCWSSLLTHKWRKHLNTSNTSDSRMCRNSRNNKGCRLTKWYYLITISKETLPDVQNCEWGIYVQIISQIIECILKIPIARTLNLLSIMLWLYQSASQTWVSKHFRRVRLACGTVCTTLNNMSIESNFKKNSKYLSIMREF